jgi:3-oxoacyl-[acyl-carrier protein] reductase
MLMSTLEGVETFPAYPELAGKRVLVTGLSRAHGVDIVRALAEHRTRLVLQIAEDCTETETIAEIAAQTALEMRLFTGPLADTEAAVRLARAALKSFNGLDMVINIVSLETLASGSAATEREVERAVTAALTPAYVISRIAANRMRTTWTEGLILNVLPEPKPSSRAARGLTAVARATLAAMTRSEAQKWAEDRIRINGVAPATLSAGLGAELKCEPDIATLALRLASRRGEDLSGYVFEAAAAE